MKKAGLALLMFAVALPMAVQAMAQGDKGSGEGRAVLTIFAKPGAAIAAVTPKDVSIKVNGKDATISGLTPFKSAGDALELVVIINSGAHNLGPELEDVGHFIQGLGSNTKVGIGYMQRGRAVLSGPLSADLQQAVSALHLPPPGPSSNVYLGLSDLAKHWPSDDRKARREVVVVDDGIDTDNPGYDANDPFVQAAISDSGRAGLVVYSVYWRGKDHIDTDANMINGGQALLQKVTQATGGFSYSQGMANPSTFQPFFADMMLRFANQYELDFSARLDRKPTVETMKLKLETPSLIVFAPEQAFVDKPAGQ